MQKCEIFLLLTHEVEETSTPDKCNHKINIWNYLTKEGRCLLQRKLHITIKENRLHLK